MDIHMKKNTMRWIFIFLFIAFAASVYANGYTVSFSDEYTYLIAGFLGWVVLGIVILPFTRKVINLPIILLTGVLTWLGMGGGIVYLMQVVTLWFFYVCWLLFFQIAIPSEQKIDNVLSIMRHGITIIAVGILTGVTGINEEERLYECWEELSFIPFLVLAAISLLLALSATLDRQKKESPTRKRLKSTLSPLHLVLVLFFLFVLLPSGVGPIVAPKFRFSPPVSRVKANMRSLATALEVYYMDYGAYPPSTLGGNHSAFHGAEKWVSEFDRVPTFEQPDGRDFATLTTPIAYATSLLLDQFSVKGAPFAYYSVNLPEQWEDGWIMWSAGPDGKYNLDFNTVKEIYDPNSFQPSDTLITFAYEPTNGLMSPGDIFRVCIRPDK